MRLSNGIVIPSYLGVQGRGVAQDTGDLTNTSLRLGEVKAIIHVGDARNLSGRYTEYNVDVAQQDGSEIGTSTMYTNCLLANTFGAGADVCRYSLRTAVKKEKGANPVGVGAKVLILCVNGETTRSVIISGVRDSETDVSKDSEKDGHNFLFEFNGLNASINKDGELKVKFRGATDTSGNLLSTADEANSNALLSLLKDGTASLADGGDGTENLELDLQNKQVRLSSAGTTIVRSPDGIDCYSDNRINLNASGVYIGSKDATEAIVHGTSWRKAEADKDQTLITELTKMASYLATLSVSHTVAGASLSAASAAHMVPMTGAIAGAPMVATAGAAITAMATTISMLASSVSSMMSAITSYEAGQNDYLSKKNFGD